MSTTVTQTPAAYRDLEGIVDCIQQRTSDAAQGFLLAAQKAFNLLASQPLLGKVSPHSKYPELRFWTLGRRFRNYVAFYRSTAEGVEIIRVLHGARNLPKVLGQ